MNIFYKTTVAIKNIAKLLAVFLFVFLSFAIAAQESYPTPKELWKDFEPDAGDFNEEVILEKTANGIYSKESYISAYINEEEVRVYCHYSVKEELKNTPALLCVHGMMGAPNIRTEYVNKGWAVMAHDYTGKVESRKHYTKYPESMSYANQDRSFRRKNISHITDPKGVRQYYYYVIQRRVLSYLIAQKEADKKRVAAIGYSVGGSLMWNLGMDSRVKAVVAYFGIGHSVYYRGKRVWLYGNPTIKPEKTDYEKMFLTSITPEAHVPYMKAATLWLNGTNDHHGGHERGCTSFHHFPAGVPWSFALQPRGHHNTDDINQNTMMWLEKHVLDKDVFWPKQPDSKIRLDNQGVPELLVKPEYPERVQSLDMYYALKEPVSHNRNWRDVKVKRQGHVWIGTMPVLNVDDYVFGFANVEYDTTVVVSTDFNAAIPSQLGNAVATDTRTDELSEDLSVWINISPAIGVGGVKGFRSASNKGSRTDMLADEKWAAPENVDLSFKFYCTEPQTIILQAGNYSLEIEITASDDWQEMTVSAFDMIHVRNKTLNVKDGWNTFRGWRIQLANATKCGNESRASLGG